MSCRRSGNRLGSAAMVTSSARRSPRGRPQASSRRCCTARHGTPTEHPRGSPAGFFAVTAAVVRAPFAATNSRLVFIGEPRHGGCVGRGRRLAQPPAPRPAPHQPQFGDVAPPHVDPPDLGLARPGPRRRRPAPAAAGGRPGRTPPPAVPRPESPARRQRSLPPACSRQRTSTRRQVQRRPSTAPGLRDLMGPDAGSVRVGGAAAAGS